MATAATEQEVIKHSVTKDEVESLRSYNLWLPFGASSLRFKILPDLPDTEGREKDIVLTSTLKSERTYWASAVHTAIAQEAAMSWLVKSDVDQRMKRGQDLLHTINGKQGWVEFMQRHLRDYLLTNNGVFLEVVRATAAPASKIIGLVHLASHKCHRTGDVENPVVYEDMLGRQHVLKAHQVLFASDFTESSDDSLGRGMCAAERAYDKIRLLQAIEGFIYGKLTGTKTVALDFIMGITKPQLDQALVTGEIQKMQNGAIHYKGITVVPFMGDKLEWKRIPFMDLPDGFNRELETKLGLMSYALALGMDFQDLYPEAVPGGLDSSAQARKLHEAARGKGLAIWEKWWEWVCNEFILPQNTSFVWSERDFAGEKLQAEISQMKTGDIKTKIEAQLLTPQQGQRILVEGEELPEWVLPQGEVEKLTLSDTEKPDEGETSPEGQALPQSEAPATAGPPQSQSQAQPPPAKLDVNAALARALARANITRKARGDKDDVFEKLVEDEMDAARQIFEQVAAGGGRRSKAEMVITARSKEAIKAALSRFSKGKVA